MARVLVIDDDESTVETLTHILRLASHEPHGTASAAEATRLAREMQPDIALVDVCLAGISGIDVIRTLKAEVPSILCIAVSGYPTFDHARDALRAGACDWLDKPAFEEDVLSAIKHAMVGRRRAPLGAILHDAEPHALQRLAAAAILFVRSQADTPSLRLLGREVGHAAGSLRSWCSVAKVQPRLFRDFSRALRAVWRLQHFDNVADANLLAIVDRRTLRKFRVAAGGTPEHLPRSIDVFLSKQRFVRDAAFVKAVALALVEHPASMRPGVTASLGLSTPPTL